MQTRKRKGAAGASGEPQLKAARQAPPVSPHPKQKQRAAAVAPAAPPPPAIFAGCSLVFLDQRLMRKMIERVKERGGAVEVGVSPATTHLVVQLDTPFATLEQRLATCPPGRSARVLHLGRINLFCFCSPHNNLQICG